MRVVRLRRQEEVGRGVVARAMKGSNGKAGPEFTALSGFPFVFPLGIPTPSATIQLHPLDRGRCTLERESRPGLYQVSDC